MKSACITGITGMTGSHLADLLIDKGYKVYGLKRHSSTINTSRIDHLYTDPHIDNSKLELAYGDLTDYASLVSWVGDIKPDLLFNMAAFSFVGASFKNPISCFDITATGALRLLEAVKTTSPRTRFLQASSSEQFGSTPPPQNEKSEFWPRSPYGVAKLAAYWATINYREAYGMFACNSLTFNHEGTRRGNLFISRKISLAATRIKLGLQDKLYVGNTSAKRDWLDARDVVSGQYAIITADEPDDYVIASGESRSVQDFIEIVFSKLNLDWKEYVVIDPRYYRPAEVDFLLGSAEKIKTKLKWEQKITFNQMVDDMIANDLELARQEKMLKEAKGK